MSARLVSPGAAPVRSTLAVDAELHTLIVQFVTVARQRVELIGTALRAGRLGEVQRLAHQLKGSAGAYGFPELSAAAAAVEAAARQPAPNGEPLDQPFEHLRDCAARLGS